MCAAVLYWASGPAEIVCTVLSDFVFGISLATTVQQLPLYVIILAGVKKSMFSGNYTAFLAASSRVGHNLVYVTCVRVLFHSGGAGRQ